MVGLCCSGLRSKFCESVGCRLGHFLAKAPADKREGVGEVRLKARLFEVDFNIIIYLLRSSKIFYLI